MLGYCNNRLKIDFANVLLNSGTHTTAIWSYTWWDEYGACLRGLYLKWPWVKSLRSLYRMCIIFVLTSFCFEGTEHVVSPVLQYVSHIVENIGIEIHIVCDKLVIRNNKLIPYKWPIIYDMMYISVCTLANSSSNYSSLSGEGLCFCLIIIISLNVMFRWTVRPDM